MRFIQLEVSADAEDDVEAVLSDEDIEYVATPTTGTAIVVEFPVPTEAVEHVLERLADRGVDLDEYTVIQSAEAVRVPQLSALEDRFVDGEGGEQSISRDEIRSTVLEMHPSRVAYYSMTVLSAVVAAAGLLLDSAAVVVGSMVIAPQVSSALATSVGIAISETRLIKTGLVSQVVGLAIAIVGATVFGFVLRLAGIVPSSLVLSTVSQIGQRISPGVLSLVIAFAAGAAGALGLATALPVSLVGVMVAAALIPAAAAVGIGVAWGHPSVALGAVVLLVVNTASINLSGVVVLWALGYRPASWSAGLSLAVPTRDRLRGLKEHVPTALALVVILSSFVVAGVVIQQQIAYEHRSNQAVERVLDGEAYESLDLVRVDVEFSAITRFGVEREVTVTVQRPSDRRFPELAARLQDELSASVGEPVHVEVSFRDRQVASPNTSEQATRATGSGASFDRLDWKAARRSLR